MRIAVVDRPLDAAALLDEVSAFRNGATILFVGAVREVNDGRAVTGIEYSAYRTMAEREMRDIVTEAAAQFGTDDLIVEHRLGTLRLGDASVVIAVAHPHRGAAYDASRYVIEQLKQRVPIWKREHYVDGSRAWVNAGHPERSEGSGASAPEPDASLRSA